MHLRVAAGVCTLATGLLIAGPTAAVAAADTGSDGAATQSESAQVATQPTGPARGPIGSIAAALRKTVQDTAQSAVQGLTGTLSSLAKPGPQQHSSVTPPKMILGGTPTVHGSTGSGTSSSAVTAVDAALVAPEPSGITSATASPASAPSVVPPPAVLSASVPPAPLPAASVPNPFPVSTNVVVPVSNVLAAVAYSVASAPALVVSLPTSATPVVDVITSLQELLTSVAVASAPLTQLPSNLSDLFGVGSAVPGATIGANRHGLGLSVATAAPIPMPIPDRPPCYHPRRGSA